MGAEQHVDSPDTAAGRILWGGFDGIKCPARFSEMAEQGLVGGAILFKRNIETLEQTQELLRSLKSHFRHAPVLAVDQEGGRVRRLRERVLELPPMRVLGDIDDEDLTERAGRVLGRHLGAIGFNCDFAPVLDVDTNPENPVIGDRSFSSSPKHVAKHGAAFARGLTASGILACGKHFPGHGDTHLDSHLALPRVSHDLARLQNVELFPFKEALSTMPMLMSAHVVFDAVDPDIPATLSKKVIHDLLRAEWNYNGVIVSDDLEMKAVSDGWGAATAGVKAIEAGCDALLVCSKLDEIKAVHTALVERAEEEPAFKSRVLDASERCRALTETLVDHTGSLSEMDADGEARALEEEIRDRAQ